MWGVQARERTLSPCFFMANFHQKFRFSLDYDRLFCYDKNQPNKKQMLYAVSRNVNWQNYFGRLSGNIYLSPTQACSLTHQFSSQVYTQQRGVRMFTKVIYQNVHSSGTHNSQNQEVTQVHQKSKLWKKRITNYSVAEKMEEPWLPVAAWMSFTSKDWVNKARRKNSICCII